MWLYVKWQPTGAQVVHTRGALGAGGTPRVRNEHFLAENVHPETYKHVVIVYIVIEVKL